MLTNQIHSYNQFNNSLENITLQIAKNQRLEVSNTNQLINNLYVRSENNKGYSEKDISKENELLVEDIKQKINTFAMVLSQIKLFNTEFKLALSVLDIFEYIFNDKKLLMEYHTYLSDLTEVFFKVFDFKAQYKNEIYNIESLKNNYMGLLNNFRSKEEYFYLHICSESESYDEEFLDKISNLLVG